MFTMCPGASVGGVPQAGVRTRLPPEHSEPPATLAESQGVRGKPAGPPSRTVPPKVGEGSAARRRLLTLLEGKSLSRAWFRWPAQGPAGRARRAGQGAGPEPFGGAGTLPGEFPDWSPERPAGRAVSPLAPSPRGGVAPALSSCRGSRSRSSLRSRLISAGSWWPVRARAPRPNSMAIVRRPLCSGGGHFLRGWAGAGGQETL